MKASSFNATTLSPIDRRIEALRSTRAQAANDGDHHTLIIFRYHEPTGD